MTGRQVQLRVVLRGAAALAASVAFAPPGLAASLEGGFTILNADTGSLLLAESTASIAIDSVVFFGRVTAPIAARGPKRTRIGEAPTGGWPTDFDPYATNGPTPVGTLAQANRDLRNAWNALTDAFPPAAGGRAGLSDGPDLDASLSFEAAFTRGNAVARAVAFASAVPEPGTASMLGLGLVALAAAGRRR